MPTTTIWRHSFVGSNIPLDDIIENVDGLVSTKLVGVSLSQDQRYIIIRECVETILSFRSYANIYGVSDYWQDVIEHHFAEKSPDLLSGLHEM